MAMKSPFSEERQTARIRRYYKRLGLEVEREGPQFRAAMEVYKCIRETPEFQSHMAELNRKVQEILESETNLSFGEDF